ncbi:MAG TPA: MotA/TolQ/ExbB proton channel family protein, partial [Phycisphaerales bacterium]|nr:MotA/TolQ/ExbB proton channel family protein [Phycisphaerales bacterium]
MMLHDVLMMVLAQTSDAPAQNSASSATQIESVWDFIVKGGPVMVPIAICSLVALTVVFERFISLRRARVAPRGFADGLKRAMQNAGGNARQAGAEFCRRNDCPLARVFLPAVQHLGESREIVERRVKEAGEREITGLRKYLRVLSVTASVSPLLGLLGTIFGMIAAFQTVAASGEALGRTELLARGIYQAM